MSKTPNPGAFKPAPAKPDQRGTTGISTTGRFWGDKVDLSADELAFGKAMHAFLANYPSTGTLRKPHASPKETARVLLALGYLPPLLADPGLGDFEQHVRDLTRAISRYKRTSLKQFLTHGETLAIAVAQGWHQPGTLESMESLLELVEQRTMSLGKLLPAVGPALEAVATNGGKISDAEWLTVPSEERAAMLLSHVQLLRESAIAKHAKAARK